MKLLTHLGVLNTKVVAAIPQPLEIVEIDKSNNQDYWAHLHQAWQFCYQNDQDFINVEHDVVTHPEVWQAFEHCPSLACAFAIWVGGSYAPGLGAVRFRAALIKEFPQLVFDAGQLIDDLLPARDWRRMDTRIWRTLKSQADIKPCIHVPPVKHLHLYPQPDPHWTK
jgi:hypothetical protein